jgi:CRISPR-associated protein (TIGR02710 family)
MLEKRGHGFEMVEDILLNAARRAAQHRYDDAAGRLYRATEMTAQIWLEEKYGIETGNVDLDKVPENTRPSLEEDSDDKGRIRIGLIKAWDLISEMPDDSVGKKFQTFRPELLKFLSVRNESLLAHGIQPVGERQFRLHSDAVSSFIGEVIDLAIDGLKKKRKIPATQFPTEFGYTPAVG